MLRPLPAELFLAIFIIGPALFLAGITYWVHRHAGMRSAWRATRDALVVATVSQLLLTAHILYSIATSRHSTAPLAIINIPFLALPISMLIFLVTWPFFHIRRRKQAPALRAEGAKTEGETRPSVVFRACITTSAVAFFCAVGGLWYSEDLERRAVAAASEKTIRDLAGNWWARHDGYVLAALVTNDACPQDVLHDVGRKPSRLTRRALARNVRTPPDILEQLGSDESAKDELHPIPPHRRMCSASSAGTTIGEFGKRLSKTRQHR